MCEDSVILSHSRRNAPWLHIRGLKLAMTATVKYFSGRMLSRQESILRKLSSHLGTKTAVPGML